MEPAPRPGAIGIAGLLGTDFRTKSHTPRSNSLNHMFELHGEMIFLDWPVAASGAQRPSTVHLRRELFYVGDAEDVINARYAARNARGHQNWREACEV